MRDRTWDRSHAWTLLRTHLNRQVDKPAGKVRRAPPRDDENVAPERPRRRKRGRRRKKAQAANA